MHLINTVMGHYPFLDKNNYLSDIVPPIIKLLPNNWISQSAFWLVSEKFLESISHSIYQLVLALILFSTALLLGRKWYLDTWLANQAINSNYIAKRKNRFLFFSLFRNSILNPQTESIIKKDLLVFMREPSQVIHISILLFLIVVFISSIAGIKYFRLGDYVLITTIYLSIYLFILLLISTLALRFIFPLISLEGMTFWKIKSAPVKNSFLIKKKVLPIGILIVIVGQGLSLFANFRLGAYMMTLFSILTLMASAAIISINFGMGILFVNYKEKNPIRLSSSQGASISFLFTIGYMLFIVAVLFEPLMQIFYSIRVNRPINFNSLAISLIPIMIVSFIVTSFFIKNGLNSLKKDF
jgi:ABC-2 type transport system permease protein